MNKFKPQFIIHPPNVPQPQPPHSATAATKSFNAKINSLSSEGAHERVLLAYSSMLKANTPPDPYTFPSLLKACTFLNHVSHGLSFHQHIVVHGYSSDSYIGSTLINFYAKIGYTKNARQVFDTMPERTVVPWTAIIGCYSREGDVRTAVSMYNQMRHEEIQPSSVTMLALLSCVLEVAHVQCVHACTVKYGFGSDMALVNSMLNVYGKCGRVNDARDMFDLMDRRDVVSWNSLLSIYALAGKIGETLKLLRRMRTEGVDPDKQTFGSLVSASSLQNDLEIGKWVHAQALTAGVIMDAHLETSLIMMYLRCRSFESAFQIFEQTRDKDVVLWTAMISGLVQNERSDKAMTLFRKMVVSNVSPNSATIASVLSACAQLGSLIHGTSIHAYTIRQRISLDVTAENSLVTMYANCGRVEQSLGVFNAMERKDVVSWNAIVCTYAQNGDLCKAFWVFNEMRATLQIPDTVTVISLLQACASIGALHQGKWIHNVVIRSCIGPSILIETALVDMYCKCGDLVTARTCFQRMSRHDLVSWSAIIGGYGSHGEGETALEMYNKFLRTGLQPNHVIFLSALSACSHNGLVNQGLDVFYSMRRDFGVEPKLEHLGCIVDLLSRAGRVEEAYNFYKRMFPAPVIDVLGILLDACRTRGNVNLGDIISREISELKPTDSGNYVQLVRSYASTDRWDDVSEAWMQMRSLGLKKLPGWSFIELNGLVTTFCNHHSSHHQYEDMVEALKLLSKKTQDTVNISEENESLDEIWSFS